MSKLLDERRMIMKKSVWLDWAVEGKLDKSIVEFVNACAPNDNVSYEIMRDGINGYAMVRFSSGKRVIEKIEAYYDGLAG